MRLERRRSSPRAGDQRILDEVCVLFEGAFFANFNQNLLWNHPCRITRGNCQSRDASKSLPKVNGSKSTKRDQGMGGPGVLLGSIWVKPLTDSDVVKHVLPWGHYLLRLIYFHLKILRFGGISRHPLTTLVFHWIIILLQIQMSVIYYCIILCLVHMNECTTPLYYIILIIHSFIEFLFFPTF